MYRRELYVVQLLLLKKMLPGGAKDKFVGFVNKIGDAMSSQFKQASRLPTESMTMQRSVIAGSPPVASRGINLGRPGLRDEWFKVTTFDAGGTAGGGVKVARLLVKARPRNSGALWNVAMDEKNHGISGWIISQDVTFC